MTISLGSRTVTRADHLATQRRHVLLVAMPQMALMTIAYLLTAGLQIPLGSFQSMMFLASSGLVMLLWLLLKLRWISSLQAATITAIAFALPMLTRIVTLLVDGTLDDPTQAVFRLVYAFYTLLYLLTALVLSFPFSRRISVTAWLVFALVITVGLAPYWTTDIHRPQLLTTLIYVWLGHGLFLTLLFGWASEQQRLLNSVRNLDASRREGERARAESEQRLRAIYEQAGVGIGLIGSDCRWADANERLCEMTGYSVEELRLMRLNELLPPEDQEAACERLTAFLHGHLDVDQIAAERCWTRKDGSRTWVAIHIRSIRVEGREGPCAAIVAIDISERKRAEQRAREYERIREFHFENAPLAVIEWTPDIRVQRWSRQAEQMFGWSESELLGRSPFDWGFVHEADRDEASKKALQLIQGPEITSRMLVRIHRKDGSHGWYQWHHSVLRDERDNVISIHSMAHDVSELRFALNSLSEREGQLRGLFEQAAVGIAMLGPDGSWLSVNERLCEILGYRQDELVKLTFQQLTHADDLDRSLQLMQELGTGARSSFTLEKRCLRKDGAIVWTAVYLRVVPATESAPQRYVAIIDDISERKRSEAQLLEHRRERELAIDALHDSEKRFRSFFNQAAVGASLLNPDGSWHTVNERLCQITGYSEAELLATDYQSITLPEDLPEDAMRARQLIDGEIDGYELEKRFIRKDGSAVWVKLYASRIEATATQGCLYVAVIEDISERKRAEERMLEHQRVREFHVENTPLAVVEWTTDLKVKRWSRRATEMFGWTEEEVIGHNPFEWRFIHEDDRAEAQDFTNRLFSGTQSMAVTQNRNYRKDGSVVWCQWYNSLLRDAQGEVISLFTLADDVTGQRETLAALHDSEARFRGLFEQAAVGIALLDLDGGWLTANARLCEIVGYSADELRRHSCLSLTHPDDRDRDEALTAQLLSGAISDFSIEKRYLHKQGGEVWVQIFVRRIEATATAPQCFVRVVEDISERKRAEADVQKLQAGLERKVSERTRQLQHTMRSWAERNHELSLLAEMMGVLPAARDATEANQIVAGYLPKLFQQFGGAIYLEDGTRDRFPMLKQWGQVQTSIGVLTSADCWALRRGQPLRVEDPGDPLLCPHLGHLHGAQEPHACIPIMALGDVVGLIHLTWSERAGSVQNPPDKVLLASTAEQVGLAIGNVRLREELHQQAMRDPLTGLYNRRYFDEYLIRRIAAQARTGRGFVLLMIDIDLFKSINDRHGHEIGDEVLRATARLLQRVVRADEAVFRLGGEEFVMIINDGIGSQALGCAERLRSEIEQHRSVHQGEELPPVTVSIGVSSCPGDAADAALLLQRADAALYTAKRTGRNRVCYAGAAADQAMPMMAVVEPVVHGIDPVESRPARRPDKPRR